MAALVLAVVTAAATTTTSGAAQRDLEATLGQALRAPGIDRRSTAAIAVDLRTGQTVFSWNAQRSLLPASAEKLC